MSPNDARIQRALDNANYRSYQRSRIPARLGKGDGSTLYAVDDSGNQLFGKVWARLESENSPRVINIGSSMVAYGLSVIVFVDAQGEYKIEGKQVASGNAYIANDTDDLPFVGDVAPHAITHGRLAPDPIIVEGLQFFPLAVRPTSPPSLSVRVEKGWYYVDGEEYPWAGGIIDLTSYVPGSANEQVPLIIAINATTNELVAYEGTTITSTSIGVPFTPSDVAGITVGDAVIRVAAVRLKNGQTSIGLIDIFEDLRPFYMAGSSGTGSGFANTALSNLTTTAINQDLLPGTDGTIDVGSASLAIRRVYTQFLNFQDADTITIAAGVAALTPPIKTHLIIAAESGTADDLVTLTGLTNGDVVILRADVGDTITLKEAGNLSLGGADIAITSDSRIMLVYGSTASKWHLVGLTSIPASRVTAGTFGTGNYETDGTLFIDGAADAVQLTVQANATQTALLAVFESSAGTDQITFSGTGAAVFNEAGNAVDFRVETDTQTHALFVDGTNNRVGILNSSPQNPLDVNGRLQQTSPTGSDNNKGILLTGSALGGLNTSTSGIVLALSNNSANNRQMLLFDSAQAASATDYGFRYIVGFSLPSIDAVTTDASTKGNMILGSTTTNVGVGFNIVTAVQADVTSKLHVIGNGTTTGKNLFLEASNGADLVTVLDNGKISLGNLQPGTIAGGRLEVTGTVSSAGSGAHALFISSADVYPLMQILNFNHDNVAINFDAYYDGGWKSSDAGSNFQLYKVGDVFSLNRASGVTAGSAVTWTSVIDVSAAGVIVINETGNSAHDVRIEGDTDANLFNTDASTETVAVGVATGSHLAKLHVDQLSTTFAKPVLALDQADVSEEFIRFIGTSANGVLTQSIVEEADVTTATRAGWVKVYVQDDGNQLTDQAYYMPVYTLA